MDASKVITVKQLADLAGVSVRTLHYYDEIDLLAPESFAGNGYRQYGKQSLLRLQQILFYRELGLSLAEIKELLDSPNFDIIAALQAHKSELERQSQRLDQLIETVENTIAHLKGNIVMSDEELFKGFSLEQQAEYETQAEQRWGEEHVRGSSRKWNRLSEGEKSAVLKEGNRITIGLREAMPKGANSPEVQELIADWHHFISQNFWSPNNEQLLGLGQLYNEDPDFRATYEAIHPDMPAFLLQAIEIYVEKQR
jgi:DNA-binding transcriptional MerR regulator